MREDARRTRRFAWSGDRSGRHADVREQRVRRVKRAIDVVGALGLMIVTAPLVAVLALVLAVCLRGNPFVAQRRIGFQGNPFILLKLRTMVRDAHVVRPVMMKEGPGPSPFKLERDPRVIPFGRLLRRYSLDELPQLYNVLVGDMSLVGPRPLFAEDIESVLKEDSIHRSWAAVRHRVPPGMTGLWQVSGRSTLSTLDLVRLDTEYVRTWSLHGDWSILARTPRAVLSRVGAY
jgi:lipopolysaccharide/colanic/teichoic acid biosynthesis glycosyltransferase